jgi:aldehyde:ferredoxin oxidoreductase
MVTLGIKALIIEGWPDETGPWVLHLSLGGARWERAGDLAGLGVYDTAPKLLEKYGDKIAAALIGPGGEMRLATAGIQNLDKDRVPARLPWRTWCRMASKGLGNRVRQRWPEAFQ